MEKTGVQRLAGALKILVTITFCCNLVALLLVPGLAGIAGEGGVSALQSAMEGDGVPGPLFFLAVCWQALWRVWREPYSAVLTLFLWAAGICTAVILWQGRRDSSRHRAQPMQNHSSRARAI